jgi:sigma-B regulation protein RsbU (phosphoserine phosphatase)
MSEVRHGLLSTQDMAVILEITRRLAAPFELAAMLAEVAGAARQVLRAERCSVWLRDAADADLVLKVASDIRDVRIAVGTGLVGACARDREIINVPDCYADPRFDPQVDRNSGFRTRCSLTLPLIDHRDGLVGVMQVLNRIDGVFDSADEPLAAALAAQCAVALQRVQALEALVEAERLRHGLEMARQVQMSALPQVMPNLPGYDAYASFKPADQTGGDTCDLASTGGQLLVVLGDATGHGIAPALSVTQMHAMLRMALRLGVDLETAFAQVNDQLADTLPDGHFITAFIGLLDPASHQLRYVCAGQGPVLHQRASDGTFDPLRPTSFPLGAMRLPGPRPARTLVLQPGDTLVLASDGIYEQQGEDGEMFGEARVRQLVTAHARSSMADLAATLLAEVQSFARNTPQQDDITIVLLRRSALSC